MHCHDWFRSANRRFIESTLINNPFLEDLFEMSALNQLVHGYFHGAPGRDLTECIAALVSFALFADRLARLPVYRERRDAAYAASQARQDSSVPLGERLVGVGNRSSEPRNTI